MQIYAELTRKQLKKIEEGHMNFYLPDGIDLNRRHGSRACFFECDDENMAGFLCDQLDNLGIVWQVNENLPRPKPDLSIVNHKVRHKDFSDRLKSWRRLNW